MIDRDVLIQQKKAQCEEKIAKLHQQIPRLEEISREIGLLCTKRIRAGILRKNEQEARAIDQRVAELMAEKKAILTEYRIPLNVYEPDWNCPKCQDKGYIHPGVLCECLQQEKLDRLFQESGIKGTMKDYAFTNFDVSYYRDPENMRRKVQKCLEFVEDIHKGKDTQNLVFMGQVGRGKTHLSVAIANKALANGNTVIYKRSEDLVEIIRDGKFGRDEGSITNDQLSLLKEVDLLIIDDLGAENVTNFAISQLRILIEDRNVLNKPWIINTNLTVPEIQQVYGERMTDRIIERSSLFLFDSEESIRIQRR